MALLLLCSLAGCGDPAEGDPFAEPSPAASGEPLPLAWPPLRQDHRGSDVVAAQLLLRQRGYQVPVDGRFDATTERAVRQLQRAWALPPDGVLGASTWPRLIFEVGAASPAAPAAAITAAQLLLTEHGHPVAPTGQLDEATALAVSELQARHCLWPTGQLGVYGWSALLSHRRYCPQDKLGTLAMDEVARLARQAGVSCGEPLAIAVAIAAAESTLRTEAVHGNGPTAGCPHGSLDVGLWQLNDCYHAEVSRPCALDATCNARAMYDISDKGTNWSPWSTYKRGSYLAWLPQALEITAGVCR